MIGELPTIAWTFIAACAALAGLAIAFGGYLLKQATWLERLLAGVGGLALLYADVRFDAAGFALLILGVGIHVLRGK